MTYPRKLATLTAFLVAVVCGTLMPARTLASCDATTIAGSYGFRVNLVQAPNIPKAFLPIGSFTPGALAGRIVFNSATDPPSVSRFLWGNIGGLPVTPASFPSTSTGTYAVNANCTGTVTFGGVVQYEIAIVEGGAEIEFAYTNSSPLSDVGEGVAKKVSDTCDATTIAGSYGFRFNLLFSPISSTHASVLTMGSFEPGALAGQIVFDSATNSISGFRAGNTGGHPVASTFTGTYSVNADCTGTVT